MAHSSPNFVQQVTRFSKRRLGFSLGVAALSLLILPRSWPVELRGLLSWNAAIALYLAFGWSVILRCDATQTRQISRQQDEHRSTIDALLLLASFASLGGVLMALSKASERNNPFELSLTLMAIVTVIVSWALVHTLYAFHYARLYYENAGAGDGINFYSDEPPDYLDFCYLAFAVGTTCGATDNEIRARRIRRTIFKHGLLSFTFITVIVALAISVVSSLLSGG